MRNKIKQLLKKEGGFTLIELLAVIAILGFIVAISIPLVGNVVSQAKKDTAAQQEELVIDAAQLYFLQEANLTDDKVTITELKGAGFLEKDYTSKEITEITKVQAENGTLKIPAP